VHGSVKKEPISIYTYIFVPHRDLVVLNTENAFVSIMSGVLFYLSLISL